MKEPFAKNKLLTIFIIIYTNVGLNLAINCPSDTWACANGIQCVNTTARCNNIIDCTDGSDETNCNTSCALNQFKCASGTQCIRQDYVCDHDNDCDDGSDENANCTYPPCSMNEFTCANKRCISLSYVCDGDDDCHDQSDEKYCSSRHCPPNQLACNMTSKCIDIEKFCNGVADCPDGSDEGPTCSSSNCGQLSCIHTCRATPSRVATGGLCYCPPGQMINSTNNRTCIDVNECEMWDECDQICVNTNNSYSCQCAANYTLMSAGHCKHLTSDSAKVLFSVGNKIYETNKDGISYRVVMDNNDLEISSFDYDYAKNTFYLTDDRNKRIYKGIYEPNGQLRMSPLISSNIGSPLKIAVDWVTGNLYVAQTIYARIDLFSHDGLNRTTLISSDLFTPSSLAVDPAESFLFFTDNGNPRNLRLHYPKIERAFMDGSMRKVIVKDKLLEPIALTLDRVKKRVFWIDRKYDHLETCDYYGLKRYVIASGAQNLPHSLSLDVFESTIYYSDTTKMSIMKLSRHAITSEANVTYHFKLQANAIPIFVKVFHETKQPKIRTNPCANNKAGCEHFCVLSHGTDDASTFRCKCHIGYQLRRDLRTCERIDEFLFVSQSNMIRAISLDQSAVDSDVRVPVLMPRNGMARSIELDVRSNLSFFYDPIRRVIFQAKYSGLGADVNLSPLVPDDLAYIENLAYDWISGNLYFSNLGKITVVKAQSPRTRRDLLRQGQVNALAVDPNAGFLFYSSLGRPARIHRSYLDGTNATVLRQGGIGLPYSLSLDYATRKIYWSDSQLKRIQFCDYSGNGVQTLFSSSLVMPGSLVVFRYNVYFVDAALMNIIKISKYASFSQTVFRTRLSGLNQIKVHSKDAQPTTVVNHPCARQNGDCSHFCFSVPSLDPQYQVSRHCGCPYGFKLDSSMTNCVNDPSENVTIRCDPPYYYRCANNRCISRLDVCDGTNDCLDLSDEQNCPTNYCSPTDQFKCRNGTCIPINQRCDGRIDCFDFSDEMDCPQTQCDRYQFKCANGSCIPISWKCDSDNDCGDSSDEANCTSGSCDPLTQFECHGQSGRCIDKALVCNGNNDCLNNFDEENCPEFTCPTGFFKCAIDRLCINATKRCDGAYDCPSYTDEQNCRSTPTRRYCRENEFECSPASQSSGSSASRSPSCIPRSWVCDGHADCDNGADESSTCEPKNCSSGYFKCSNNNCIPLSWICDGEDDCGDNSDERTNCPAQKFRCPPGQIRCLGQFDMCINQTQVCDNIAQCPDGSDEGGFCSRDDCSIQNGGCSHTCQRSPMGSICICPSGYETRNETNYKKCEDIDECAIEGSCQQLCANTRGGYNCACAAGYYRSGRKMCKALTRDYAQIYVTNAESLIISNVEGTRVRAIRKPTMRWITAFDFHNQTGRVYWADWRTKAIYSSFENGSDVVKIVSSGVSIIETLAVDWIGQNIYWVDYVMQHIEVSKLDGKRRRILFNENVTNPRGLVLDPRAKSRYMFWTDWGKYPRIERANLDGRNRTAIITTKVYWPNGLAIDLIRERLYFADAHLDYIESCDYEGRRRTQILGNDLLLHHPHSLSVFENNIYWVDRGHKKLIRINMFDPANKTIMADLSLYALNVKVVHGLLQPSEENPCARANCEHLCLLSKDSPTGFRCHCQIGYVKDPANDNRCNIDRSEFLLLLNKNIIGGLRIFANDTQQTEEQPTTSIVDSDDDSSSDVDDESSELSSLARESGFVWDRLVPVNDIQSGYDFAYDYREQSIYWLEHNSSFSSVDIKKVKFDGEDRTTLVSNDLVDHEHFDAVFTFEFDAASRNLFVGNMFQSQIEVISVETRHRTVVYSGSNSEMGVGRPAAIAVNYDDAEVYWIDNGFEAVPLKIGACKMDGSLARNLIQTDLNQPYALIYHPNSRKIFWSDVGRKKIESASALNPMDRTVVVSDVEYPVAIAIWDIQSSSSYESTSILYYSDQVEEVLVAFNLKTSEKRIVKSNVADIAQIKIYQEPKIPQSNPCLVNNGGCHQICLPSARESVNGRVCRCSNGLQLQVLDGSCRPYQSFILFASSRSIRAVPFVDVNEKLVDSPVEALPGLSGNQIGKFDFDYKSRAIMWIENERFVKVMHINFAWVSDLRVNRPADYLNSRVLFELDSSSGTLLSLAFDWINNLLYYSYTDPPFNYIKVTKFPECDNHMVIFTSKSDMPTSLAVNPRLRYLYWIDRAQFAKLERAFLNGSNRTTLIKSDLYSPTDLYVDSKSGDVYWSDNTRDRIERCDWDGKNRSVIKSTNLPNPKSVFVLDGVLFYADSRLRSINSVNLSFANTTSNQIKRVNNAPDLNEVIVFSDKSQPSDISSPCASSSGCEQFCFAMPQSNTPKCACGRGELESNGRTCKTPREYLIFAMENEIRSVSFVTGGGEPWRPITGLNRAIGIDFDYRDNKVFFTDVEKSKISWFTPGSENPFIEELISPSTGPTNSTDLILKPEGIAYDWVTDTFYYTDNGLNIIVSYQVATRMRYVIAYSDAPRAIVVHPCKGLLFWSDVGKEPMIVRSSLAGSQYEKIITTDIKWPNGLTIDFEKDKLYWADAYYDKIETCDFDGNYRKVLSTTYHPFAVTVHGHFIYWTDWRTNSIYRAEKYAGSNTMALVQGLPKRPMDLHVWSEQRQQCIYTPCSVYNGGCSHICSVAPPGNRTECRCPFGMRLRLTNGDRTCSAAVSNRCNATQFTCSNGGCINKRFVCDGQRHCSDNSDEAVNYCAFHKCLPSEFRCRNGRCIPMPERCDRVDQCGDNSDELNCVYPTCNAETEFQCRNFKCIPISSRCNGFIDCQDGNSTDEVGCPPINCTSPIYNVKCPNTNVCIMNRWLCDGDNDCGDNADENRLFCESVPCASNQFRCKNHRCISYTWYCDGDKDCPEGEDEPQGQCQYGNFTCPPELFKCDIGRCISRDFVCDGDRDCPDNSDEDEERHNCQDRPCRANEFRCESGVRGRTHTKCIRTGLVCDGYPHCVRGEDETSANCTRAQCRSNEFRCNNGLCINANYRCDHDDDCGDGSDEPHNCTFTECTSNQFKCDNLRCISKSLMCNQRNDCFDNSDEKPQVCQNSTCTLAQYQCRNGSCISNDLVCNQRNDCGDNSDETGCGINECASPILNRCDHFCRDTLTSFKCECRPGFKLLDRYRCIDINECTDQPWLCSQLCENRIGSYMCKCGEGFEKSSNDSRYCKFAGEHMEPDLIYTSRYYLRNISLILGNANLIKQGFIKATGLSYDLSENNVFVFDAGTGELHKIRINTSLSNVAVSSEVILHDAQKDQRGLAVDWIGRKIYYLSRSALYVCELNGHYKTVLLNSSYLQEPTSIVVDPFAGYVFFTDWAYPPFIGRIGLDGKNFTKIVTQDIGNPIGLAIDIVTKRIWWTDTHLKRIEFSNYNGRNRFIAVGPDQTAYPYALSFYDGRIYWHELSNHSIYSADALSGANKTVIRSGTIHTVFALSIYHRSMQSSSIRQSRSGANPCSSGNGGCSHLCLSSGPTNYTCACPDGFELTADARTCRANCSSWHFRCGPPDEKCILALYRCDGERDCRDGSDEVGCPPRVCPSGLYQCANDSSTTSSTSAFYPRCISFAQVCNGYPNCPDATDERECADGCPPGRFQCPVNKRCILNSQLCNGLNDCGDSTATDEQNCANFTCPSHRFRCNSGHCINSEYFCDEEFDCADKSDEPAYECRNRQCPSGWTRCGNYSYKCIKNTHLCDGYRNCPSGDDENTDRCPTCHSTGDFKCANNRCVLLSLRCNGVDDCGDDSDESPALCREIGQRECSESEFKCANGNCIRGSWKCDHYNDCGDNSDERNCQQHSCGENQWQCRSGHCIPANQHCNGIRNCLDFSDETSCPPRYPDGKYCEETAFTCNNTFCINPDYMCDGDNDCGDGSDEILSLCSSYNCTEENSRFRCKNGLCIYSNNVCNGFNDCSDGSDEDFTVNGPCKSQHIECGPNEFKCSHSHSCIPFGYVCDNDFDCGEEDESDELGCYTNRTQTAPSEETSCAKSGHLLCEQNCTDMPELAGFICSCHRGFKMIKLTVVDEETNGTNSTSGEEDSSSSSQERRHSCEDIDECATVSLNHCPHSCENLKGSFQCHCANGFVDPHGDGTICEPADSSPAASLVVLIAYGTEIRQVRPNFTDYSYTSLIEDEQEVSTLDVDPIDRILYYVDGETQKLKRTFIPVSSRALGHSQELIQTSMATSTVATRSGSITESSKDKITALGVDWLAKNLYYVQGTTIRVAKSDGRYPKTLIVEHVSHDVRSLLVNPIIGKLFWINVGSNRAIMSSKMNGEEIKTLVSSNLDSPDSLAIDYHSNNRIYWCDHKQSVVESVSIDGTDRVKLYHIGITNPVRLDLFANHVYLLSQPQTGVGVGGVGSSLTRLDKFGRGAYVKLVNGIDLVEDVKVFHQLKVPSNLVNPCDSANCSHLCLLKSSEEYECACPDNSDFLEGDLSTCDSPLESKLEDPLACRCVHCWCWYNEFGVHYKCLPGYKGDLCETDDAASRALIRKVTAFSAMVVGLLTVTVLLISLIAYSFYKRRQNHETLSLSFDVLNYFGLRKSNEDTISRPPNMFNPELASNSDISPTPTTSKSSSSKLSKTPTGLLNPVFSKHKEEENGVELVMDELSSTDGGTSSIIDPNVNIELNVNSIFSNNLEKDKSKKSKKKSKGEEKQQNIAQFDPSTKETFKDTVNLIEPSTNTDN